MTTLTSVSNWNRTSSDDSIDESEDEEARNKQGHEEEEHTETISQIYEEQRAAAAFRQEISMAELFPKLSEPFKEKSLSSNPSFQKLSTVKVFFSKAAVVVFTDCLNQLLILDNIYSKYVEDVEEIKELEYIALSDRFGLRQVNYDPVSFKAESVNNNFQKLRKECRTLIHIISQLIEELAQYKYTKLAIYNCNYIIMKNEEDDMLTMAAEKNRYFKQLKNMFIMEMREAKKAREKMERDINDLKDQRENYINFANRKSAYYDHWQHSREEQNDYVLLHKEDSYQMTIDGMNWKSELENRAHSEITLYVDELKQDQQNLIEHWMTTYDNKVEELDDAILKIKMDHENLKEKQERLQETYIERQKEIDEYLAHKAKLKAESDYRLLQFLAAVKVQAWWRGTMVRRHLGPYKKEKKKGKGKGKENKGKKGKTK